MSRSLRRVLGVLALLGLAWLVMQAFRTAPVLVDVATVRNGTLRVTLDDDGRTRVRERFTISAPIDGRLVRTILDPGDAVRAGATLVAEFEPVVPALLDLRARTEAEARIGRARAGLQEAEARHAQAEADHGFARSEVERLRALREQGFETLENVERGERDERRAFEGLRAAAFAVQVAEYELEVAQASLVEPAALDGDLDPAAVAAPGDGSVDVAADGRLLLRSPVDGAVLRVFEESARTLPAGTPILEVGAVDTLEVVADYLSQDAVKITPGMQALVGGWGGEDEGGAERVLQARVRVVEPAGFTKVSALGVEEQRVNVILDPAGDSTAWSALGDGYRVELRVLLWEGADVLIVPTGALFREEEAWMVFLVRDGRAAKRPVRLGRMNGLEAQVLEGLAAEDRVVLYPSELISDGTPIEVR